MYVAKPTETYKLVVVDILDAAWQFYRQFNPQYKNIDSIAQLYKSKIELPFQVNYDTDFNNFKKQIYINITGKHYDKQKQWLQQIITDLSDKQICLKTKLLSIDSFACITNKFIQLQQYFIDKDVHAYFIIAKKILFGQILDYDVYVV